MTTSSSSRLPLRDGARRVVAWLAAAALLAFPATASASPTSPPTPVSVHRETDGEITVILPIGSDGGSDRPDLEVVDDTGADVSWSAAPLVGRDSPLALVLGAGAAADGGRLGATAIDLLLRLPTGVRTTVVAGGEEPAVIARPHEGVAGAVRAVALLGDAGGNTAGAVRLAAEALRQESDRPRMLVVYPDGAPQEVPAGDLAAAIAAANAVPLVVVAGAQQEYWQAVVDGASGQLVAPGADAAAAGADVARRLARLQAVTLRPAWDAGSVHLRLAGDAGEWTAEVVLPDVQAAAEPPATDRGMVVLVVAALGALMLAGVGLLTLYRRRRHRRHHHRHLAAGVGTASPNDPAWRFWRRGGPNGTARRSQAAHRG